MSAYRRNRYTISSASDSDDEESDHQPRGVVARHEFLLENGTRVAEQRPLRGGSFSPCRDPSSKRSNPPQIGPSRGDAPPIRGSPLRRPPSPHKARPASRGRTSPTKSPSFKREIAASRKPSYRGDLSKEHAELSRAETSPLRVQSSMWDSAPKGGFFVDFSSRGQSGFETNGDELPVLIRNVSLRVKQQIQTTLSDPLKRRAAGSLRRARDRAAIPAASVRQKVHEISNRLTMPKFFTDERSSSDIDGNANDEASSSEESDDPEFLELQERSAIVEKYEKGAEQEVEEWENPDFELYKTTDRYGFVHKNGEVLSPSESHEKKRIAKEASRERKWLRMMAAWRAGKTVEKLRDRVWKGVPEKLRAVVWAYLLDVERYKSESPTNVYRELLMRARLVSRDIKQIDLDINRTYRDHLAFRRRYDLKQQSLFNVLAAYAMYNTEVGYCQGMSQIAALFLMYMDEEDAFWCLHALLVSKKHAMHGFFVPGFPKLARFQAHYEKVLHKYLPRLKKHLDKAGIPPIYLTKWWFGCFLDRVPFPLALRLWDVFLLEGDVILIAMAYNIMKMHQKAIKKLQIENFMEYIQTTIAQNFGFSDEETMYSLRDCLRKLQSDRMTLPPPPGASDPPELPMKPLGPVLSRSMVDIRMDIAEIQSRCSRANSLAGKSPGVTRRHRTPPSPTPMRPKFIASPSMQKDPATAAAIATQRDFEAQRDLSALTTANSPSSHSSSSTVRENATARVVARHGDVSPTSAMTPLAVSAPRPPVTPRLVDRQRVHSPPSANALAPSHSVRLPNSVPQQLRDGADVSGTRESSIAHNPSKVASPPLVVERMRVGSPDAVSSHAHIPLAPPSQIVEAASRRSSRQHVTSSLQREPMRGHMASEPRDLPFRASPAPKVAEHAPPPEPPVDYNNSGHHSIAPGGGSPPIPSPPVDPYPPRNMLETPATYRSEIVYDGSSGNCAERRMQPAFPGNERSTLGTCSQKSVDDVNERKSSSGSRIVQRDSFYDNVPPPTPALRCDADEAATTFDKRRAGGPRRAPGELIYESRSEDRSMERRFRNQQNSPTLFESRRQQTVTEVETRVIQLPNNVTYVSVGDDSCDNIRRTPVQHFHSGYGSPRRFEPTPSGFRTESYSPYDEPRRFRQGMEEMQMKSQTGAFLSHFRDESVGGGARGKSLQNTPSTVYYPLDGRRYAPAIERRPTPPSRSHHFPFPTETRGKHSMV